MCSLSLSLFLSRSHMPESKSKVFSQHINACVVLPLIEYNSISACNVIICWSVKNIIKHSWVNTIKEQRSCHKKTYFILLSDTLSLSPPLTLSIHKQLGLIVSLFYSSTARAFNLIYFYSFLLFCNVINCIYINMIGSHMAHLGSFE